MRTILAMIGFVALTLFVACGGDSSPEEDEESSKADGQIGLIALAMSTTEAGNYVECENDYGICAAAYLIDQDGKGAGQGYSCTCKNGLKSSGAGSWVESADFDTVKAKELLSQCGQLAADQCATQPGCRLEDICSEDTQPRCLNLFTRFSELWGELSSPTGMLVAECCYAYREFGDENMNAIAQCLEDKDADNAADCLEADQALKVEERFREMELVSEAILNGEDTPSGSLSPTAYNRLNTLYRAFTEPLVLEKMHTEDGWGYESPFSICE